jgi:hypothetical protein
MRNGQPLGGNVSFFSHTFIDPFIAILTNKWAATVERAIAIIESRAAAAQNTVGNVQPTTACPGEDPASRALNRLGDILEGGRGATKPTRKVCHNHFENLCACLSIFLLIKLEEHKIWDRLAKVDMECMDEWTVPPLGLLNYLRDKKEATPKEVPFVELMTLCIPDWST